MANSPQQVKKYTASETIDIYVDWANHYLEKVNSKKRIQDLQTDVCDGILLCDIVEAVTNQKISKINRKPKNTSHMLENVVSCLSLLNSLGVAIEGVSASDVCEGNLKSILGLFFSLSRYKQKQRQQQKHLHESAVATSANSKMPSPQTRKRSSGIPTPAQRNSNTSVASKTGSRSENSSSSRPNSSIGTHIPTVKATGGAYNDKTQRSGIRPPSIVGLSTLNSSSINNNSVILTNDVSSTAKKANSNNGRIYNSSSISTTPRLNKQVVAGSKRTSSSSGFSSARSERSDSSTSISSIPTSTCPPISQAVSAGLPQAPPPMQQPSKISKTSLSPRTAHKLSKKKDANLNTIPATAMPVPVATAVVVQNAQAKEAGVFSAIPKPMAAIKGTSKVPTPEPLRFPKPEAKNVAMVCPMSKHETLAKMQAESTELLDKKPNPDIVLQPPDNESDDDFVESIKPLSLIRPRYYLGHHKGARQNRRNIYIQNDSRIFNFGGYMSDGDALQNASDSDYNDGYLSEGALCLSQNLQDSPGDDSSSVSSEVSDPPQNDLSYRVHHSELNNGYGQSYSKQHYQHQLNNQQHVPDVEKHGNKVKMKSSCSQQTDDSAFRQGNQWKKYPLPLDGVYQSPMKTAHSEKPELRRGKSDLGDKSLEKLNKSPVISSKSKNLERSSRSGKEEKSRRSSSQQTPESMSSQQAISRMSPYTSSRLASGNYMHVAKKSSSSSGSSSGSKNNKLNNEDSSLAHQQSSPMMKNNTGSPVNSSPRTRQSKVKISGGTQTNNIDTAPMNDEYGSPNRKGSASSYKSYSLTMQGASKLSANIRERLLLGENSHTLPKQSGSEGLASDQSAGNVGQGYSTYMPTPTSPRVNTKAPPRFTDGSLSDTTYATYSELTAAANSTYGGANAEVGSPYSWLRHSSTHNTSIARCAANSLTDSTDSLSSMGSAQNRASLSHTRMLFQNRESPQRLNRSNSIRSTKSEKLYPSMLQRSEDLLHNLYYYNVQNNGAPGKGVSAESQPTSPTQINNRQSTSSRNAAVSSYANKSNTTKNDDVNGSSLSLVSTASSLYSTAEEKQANEIRKLRRELIEAQDKVHTLTSQLSTNAHVVSAFESSLANMTHRLQQMISTSEKKDHELHDLRATIEALRQQSIDGGLINGPALGTLVLEKSTPMHRQLSIDSVSSLSSACSGASSGRRVALGKKKKGWLRSSFSKAFSRNKKERLGSLSLSDVEDGKHETVHESEFSAPTSPMVYSKHHHQSINIGSLYTSEAEDDEISSVSKPVGTGVVHELQQQLREKDLVLTDIRLEALSSAHQLESLKDTVHRMRNEMLSLKQDNERLQRIVTNKSLTSSQSSLPIPDNNGDQFSLSENTSPTATEFNTTYGDTYGTTKVRVTVMTSGKHVCSNGAAECEGDDDGATECAVATVGIGANMQWDSLDGLVRKCFLEYVSWLDPGSNLGLQPDSVLGYHLGKVHRAFGHCQTPDLLPAECLHDDVSIRVCLRAAHTAGSMDALAFDTLIPKPWLQRYISMLSEHRRIIFCGPSGTGKSYLANKISQYLVQREGREANSEAIASFNVDHNSSKELKQYLANISEQCESNAMGELPSVIILDNLHNVASLSDIFNGFLRVPSLKCPYIIGTMNQTTCSSTNLQLHHNFRWVLCSNHLEPVKGLPARFLKRRLLEAQIKSGNSSMELAHIFDWIPRVWQHLNKFLELHSSSDVTIGPRLFLLCPVEVAGSQVWFTDLWNYSVVPYLLVAVREGIQLYGRRGPWEDPTTFIAQTYPWKSDAVNGGPNALINLRPDDVGYELQTTAASSPPANTQNTSNAGDADPLLNMLMRLQEAANYSSPHSDIDSTLDTTSDKLGHPDLSGNVLDDLE